MGKATAGITGSFSMLFLMAFGRWFSEKISFGIFFSPSKPNNIRLMHAMLRDRCVDSVSTGRFLNVNSMSIQRRVWSSWAGKSGSLKGTTTYTTDN